MEPVAQGASVVFEAPKTQEHLRRIASALDVPPGAFRATRSVFDEGPDAAERAEAALLFSRLTAPDQRAAIVSLLRALVHPSERR